jgi:hypothetical protein
LTALPDWVQVEKIWWVLFFKKQKKAPALFRAGAIASQSILYFLGVALTFDGLPPAISNETTQDRITL